MRVFRIVLTGEEPPHYTITKAFERGFEQVDTLYWDEFKDMSTMNEIVRARVIAHRYDLVFMQLQAEKVIEPNTAKVLHDNAGLVVNWTGDVRRDITWFREIGPYVVTAFTNETDVERMRRSGHRAEYLQTGYDHVYYQNRGMRRLDNIAFCGNYYPQMQFPLTKLRSDTARLLKLEFPENFNLYGRNWDLIGLKAEGFADNEKESLLYNVTSMALSISHFNYSRYYSDRLLREMACGCCVLSHRFKDCEKEFVDGKHIVYFDNAHDLVKKIAHFRENPNHARRIGDEAARHVSSTLKWDNFVANLKTLTEKYKNERTATHAVSRPSVQR